MTLKYRIFRNVFWALSYVLGLGVAKYVTFPLMVHYGIINPVGLAM